MPIFQLEKKFYTVKKTIFVKKLTYELYLI